jgi:hypothetical protein
MMYGNSTVGGSVEIVSHHACVVYDERTGTIHHIHDVINLAGATEPTEDEMTQRARANARVEAASGKAVLVVPGTEIQRGKSYRVDHAARALVVDQNRTGS